MVTSLPVTSPELQAQIANLRATFAAVAIPTLTRYTELVGANMAAALRGTLNDVAQANHWDIRVTLSGLADTHSFETLDTAARVYQILVRTIINHMATVIGAHLTDSIVREITQQLDPAQHQLIQSYHLVPESLLSGLAR
jgi:hypothetical protein